MSEGGKFDDRGYFGSNKFRKTEKAPTHTGKITLSKDTLMELNRIYKDGGDATLALAGWRKNDNPGTLSLKVSIPRPREEGDPPPRRSGGGGRSSSNSSFKEEDFGGDDDLL